MKKYWFILFLLCLCLKVNALVNMELNEPFISFAKEGDYVLQGFTSVNNKLFTVFIDPEELKPMIKVFDLDTGKLIKSYVTSSVGHANDVTYNSKENKIYVVYDNGTNIVSIFDGNTFTYLNSIEVSLSIRSMTYIEDKDIYAVRTVANGYYLNSDLSLTSKLPFVLGMNFSLDVARQGWTYNNGLIYYSTWSWIRFGGDGVNTIYVYNMDGNLLDQIVTKGDIGELEDVAFYNNKMILGINTYDDYIEFYMEDIPVVNEVVLVAEDDEEIEKKDNTYIYWFISLVAVVIITFAILRIKKRCL